MEREWDSDTKTACAQRALLDAMAELVLSNVRAIEQLAR